MLYYEAVYDQYYIRGMGKRLEKEEVYFDWDSQEWLHGRQSTYAGLRQMEMEGNVLHARKRYIQRFKVMVRIFTATPSLVK